MFEGPDFIIAADILLIVLVLLMVWFI